MDRRSPSANGGCSYLTVLEAHKSWLPLSLPFSHPLSRLGLSLPMSNPSPNPNPLPQVHAVSHTSGSGSTNTTGGVGSASDRKMPPGPASGGGEEQPVRTRALGGCCDVWVQEGVEG